MLVANTPQEEHRRCLEVLAPHLKDVLNAGNVDFVLGKLSLNVRYALSRSRRSVACDCRVAS